jgi:hypothetical protein
MNYLNARQRSAVASLILSVGISEDIIRQDGTTKEEKRRLLKMQEWSEKYISELAKRVPEDMPRIMRIFKDSEIITQTKQAVKHKYITVQAETVDDLIEVAVMDKCKNCKGSEYKDCKLFGLQQDLNVFMVQDREGFCPYAYDEEE